jgi:hypothetical protein
MTDKFDFEHLEEGDSFEGGPLEQSVFISELQAAGGEFELKGNKVLIKKLAKKEESKAKAAPSSKKTESKDEPKKETPKKEVAKDEPKKETPKKEDHKTEAPKDVSNDKTKE